MKGKPIEIDCRECANCTGHSCKKFGADAAKAVKKCASTAFRSYRKKQVMHEIKILPQYFADVHKGIKQFELRKDDRNYQVYDLVTLREWNGKEYTGNKMIVGIKYVLRDCPEYGLKDGYCIFGW